MGGSTRKTLFTLILGLAAAALAGAAVYAGAAASWLGVAWHGIPLVPAASAILVVMLAWVAVTVLDSHFDQLERLRGALVSGRLATPGAAPPADLDAEAHRLGTAAISALERVRTGGAETARDRLAAVLATLDEAIVVITEAGQVSLVNAPARAVLGPYAMQLGTSVFSVLDRSALDAALDAAVRTAAPVSADVPRLLGGQLALTVADLPGHGGAVLRFAGNGQGVAGGVEHDLALHDRPPAVRAAPDSLLGQLPGLVFDCETTGLDVAADRLISAGAVRVHGRSIYPGVHLDVLVDPGVPVPARSTAVHGITDAMLAGAPPFAALLERLHPLLAGCVVIGHNIGFDLAILRNEARRAGVAWDDPPALDTLALAARLWPDVAELDLEQVAARLAIDVRGRHTALGDALVTAEVWSALVPLLQSAGVGTLAEAQAFQAGSARVRAHQRAAGW